MKKVRFFTSWILPILMVFSLFVSPIRAEGEDETGAETEHWGAYYEDIQTNQIPGWPEGGAVEAKAAVLLEANTGAVLYGKNMELELPPASITKIMTALIALENGDLSDTVVFSEYAVNSIEYGSSHLGLTAGEELTLEQCLYGIMLASANEVSNAVAEHIGGNIKNFTEMMNVRAAELGCTHTHFVNAHGLNEPDHYVCALDMARIMREAIKNEEFRKIIGTVEYHYPETNLVDEKRYFMNHHKMIAEPGMEYEGCIGGKNGFTDQALNTLVTAAERDGMTLVAVVLQSPGMYESYSDTRTLLDYGFDNFSNARVTNENTADMEIVGMEDADERSKIQQADILQKPFSMVGSTLVTLPAGIAEQDLARRMDFASGQLVYAYSGQVLGSVPFSYTGEWEAQTEVPMGGAAQTGDALASDAAGGANGMESNAHGAEGNGAGATADGAQAQDAPGLLSRIWALAKAGAQKVLDGAVWIYDRMDAFIKRNTVACAIAGGVLLIVILPMLLLARTRYQKEQRLYAQRREELAARREIEARIERESTAQTEAELRARERKAVLGVEDARDAEDVDAPDTGQGTGSARDARGTQKDRPRGGASETQEIQETHGAQDFGDMGNARESRGEQSTGGTQRARGTQKDRPRGGASETQEIQEIQETRDAQGFGDMRNARESRGEQEMSDARAAREARKARAWELAQEPEDEYIEVPIEDAQDPQDSQDPQ